MIVDFHFGKIGEKGKELWNNKEKEGNPYEILEESFPLDIRFGSKEHNLLEKYGYNEIQIDWGSYGWKISREKFCQALKEIGMAWQNEWDGLKDEDELGMVWIEQISYGEILESIWEMEREKKEIPSE